MEDVFFAPVESTCGSELGASVTWKLLKELVISPILTYLSATVVVNGLVSQERVPNPLSALKLTGLLF